MRRSCSTPAGASSSETARSRIPSCPLSTHPLLREAARHPHHVHHPALPDGRSHAVRNFMPPAASDSARPPQPYSCLFRRPLNQGFGGPDCTRFMLGKGHLPPYPIKDLLSIRLLGAVKSILSGQRTKPVHSSLLHGRFPAQQRSILRSVTYCLF